LVQEFPDLKTFATLSPVPGFLRWLRQQEPRDVFSEAELKAILGDGHNVPHPAEVIVDGDWIQTSDDGAIKAPLQKALARYLMHAKRASGAALDSVAHFHLSNGASLERINWKADLSDKGLRQSAGMMVNYVYRRPKIDANHEAYSGSGKIASSGNVRSLAKKP
jgi:malonyl-CoA decarboxylase